MKKNLKLSLLLMDLVVLVMIFVSVYLLFELVINKILINYNIDKFYESMRTAQFDLNNSINYIEEKKELDYKNKAEEIFNYLKLSALKRAKYDNSIFIMLFPEEQDYSVTGEKKKPDIKFGKDDLSFDNFKNKIEMNKNTNNEMKSYIDFKVKGNSYIGIAQYSGTGIRKALNRKNSELVYPILIIADNKDDFFYLLNRVRNIFFILLSIVFGLGAVFKIYNTIAITREIYDIRDRMLIAGKNIREQGLIGEGKTALNKKFIETTDLDHSFSDITGSLIDLGDIISGIADRDLFIATLKKDNSLINPHYEMMTVMFLDIQDFTGITEKHRDNIMEIVNHIWTEVENVIEKHKGKINKLIGDAALLIFLDKHMEGETNSSLNAFYSAAELLERVPEIGKDLDIDFNFRIGLDYGKVNYGKTGTDKNYELGVIGDTVNTASRLEALCKQYHTNLLLTENVFSNLKISTEEDYCINKEINSACDSFIRLFKIDKARPKGKKEAKEIFTVLKRKDNQYALIGKERYFDIRHFNEFHRLLNMFFNSIQEWRGYYDRKQKENEFQLSRETVELRDNAEKKWSDLVKILAGFYIETGFPIIDHFIKSILKFEEYDEFMKIPDEWIKKDIFSVKEPSSGWIESGTIELEK